MINTATPQVSNKSEATNTLNHEKQQINQFPKEEHNQQMTQTNYIIIQTGILVKKRGQAGTKAKYQVDNVQHTETTKTKCIFFFSLQYWQSNCCALRVNEHISTTYMKVFCSRA